MSPLLICQNILSGIQKKISSPDFTSIYHEKNRFVRKRKLNIVQVIFYLLYSSKASMFLNLSGIRDDIPDIAFPEVSKQAVSKARNAISPALFRDLFHFSAETFYASHTDRNLWHGYHLFAVDGSTVQVPKTKQNDVYFGVCHNQHKSREDAMAGISVLYDISNDILVDGIIQKYPQAERSAARKHLEYLETVGLSKKQIILFDRGYPSYDLFRYISEKGYFFLMRVQKNTTSLTQLGAADAVTQYLPRERKKEQPVMVRVIHIILDDGTDECLVTNLFDPDLDAELLKELYFYRWGIEGKYNELKNQMELEEFTGATPTSVEQDFYISLLLMNLCALIKADADAAIKKDTETSGNRFQYQANRAFLLGKMKKRLVLMLCGSVGIPLELERMLQESVKRRSQIQPDRKCKRPRIQLRRRHCKNRKTCM